MFKGILIAVVVGIIALNASESYAGCRCVCSSNSREWICTNSWDVPVGYCGGWCSSSIDTNDKTQMLSMLFKNAPDSKKDYINRMNIDSFIENHGQGN